MPVYTTHLAYDDAVPLWLRCRHAFAGTDAVKKATIAYLPMLEGHTMTNGRDYQAYLTRAMFYPAMSRTVLGLAGLVFGKPPTVTGVPKSMEKEFEDVTLSGVPLDLYALQLCLEVLITGRAGVLIDMPSEAASGIRPYWSTYAAENIVNWRASRINGVQTLTLVVLKETKETIDVKDPFVPTYKFIYRVLRLVDGRYTVTLFEEDPGKAGTWIEGQEYTPLRRGQALPYIPFAFINSNDADTSVTHPPLLDLVDVNFSHYRTSADQEHGAHYTALPTPYVTGHTLGPNESLGIGSGAAWVLPNPSATAGMVEFTGAGLKALAEIKEEKRLLMATLGARMLETQSKVAETATTVSMRHAGERSSMTILSDTLGHVISQCLRWHLFWTGLEEGTSDKATFECNPDVVEQLTPEDINALVAAWQAGAISHKTVYFNLEWGEWTRPGISFDEEVEDIEDEEPEPDPTLDLPPQLVPGLPGGPPDPNAPPPDPDAPKPDPAAPKPVPPQLQRRPPPPPRKR